MDAETYPVWRCGRCGWDTPDVECRHCDICGCGFGTLRARFVTLKGGGVPLYRTPQIPSPLPGAKRRVRRNTVPQFATCSRCGDEYEVRRKGGSYCGAACRNAAHRAKRNPPLVL